MRAKPVDSGSRSKIKSLSYRIPLVLLQRQRLDKMHAARQQALTEIKALRQCHMEAGIQDKVLTSQARRFVAHRRDQESAETLLTLACVDDQIVDIDEAAIYEVFRCAITDQAHDSVIHIGAKQPISMRVLTRDLFVERGLVGQVWAQFAHQREACPLESRVVQFLKFHGWCHRCTSLFVIIEVL